VRINFETERDVVLLVAPRGRDSVATGAGSQIDVEELTQLYQFALPRDDFAWSRADKCESNQWSALANRL